MAQTGYTPIKLYASTTASAVPLAANLDNTNGAELAINITDGKLFYKDNGGTVQTIATKATSSTSGTSILYGNGSGGFSNVTIGSGISFAGGTLSATGSGGTVTSVAVSGGSTGLTTSGGPITGSGTITLAGTLGVANGGTGATTAAGALTNLGALPIAGGTMTGTLSFSDWSQPTSTIGTMLDAPIYTTASPNYFELNAIFASIPNGALYVQDNNGGAKFVKSIISGSAYGAPLVVGAGTTGQTIVSAGTGTVAAWGTLPVSGGGTGATTLTGLVKGNGTSAFTAATAGTDYVAPGTATTFTALQTFSGSSSVAAAKLANAKEVATVSATAATGTINYDVTTQSVIYYTSNASANWTVNFRGSSGTSLNTLMSTGESMTVAFLVTQGSTAYYNSAVQVDGASVTPKYQGGTAWSAGNASSIDSYVYTIVKTGNAAFTVFASQTKFA
jgi:hypothetical protein